MSDNTNPAAQSQTPVFPLRPGSGGLSSSPTAGGLRRVRKPFLDIGLHDAKVKLEQSGSLLDMAWGLLANAYGGSWEKATPEWQQMAAKWRDQYFAERGNPADVQQPIAGMAGTDIGTLEAAAAANQVAKDVDANAMLQRLLSLPADQARTELPDWDGTDATFTAAVSARWAELNPEPDAAPVPQEETEFGKWLLSLDTITQLYFLGDTDFSALMHGSLDFKQIPFVAGSGVPLENLPVPDVQHTEDIRSKALAWDTGGRIRGENGEFIIRDPEPEKPDVFADAGDDDGPLAQQAAAGMADKVEEEPEPEPEPEKQPEPAPAGDPEPKKEPVDVLVENLSDKQAETLANVIEGTQHLRDKPSTTEATTTPVEETAPSEQPALQAGDKQGSESPAAPKVTDVPTPTPTPASNVVPPPPPAKKTAKKQAKTPPAP